MGEFISIIGSRRGGRLQKYSKVNLILINFLIFGQHYNNIIFGEKKLGFGARSSRTSRSYLLVYRGEQFETGGAIWQKI